MPDIEIQKVTDVGQKFTLPLFKEMEMVLDRIRSRAFELCSRRGFGGAHALDDWLAAEREICWPAAELAEENGTYKLSVAVPGFERTDISVAATPHELIVHAKSKTEARKEPEAKKSEKVCWSEFRSNDVYRQVELPEDIDPDSVTASLNKGMLEITARKKPARVIPIAAAAA
jgi:HSP20 family protein